MRDGSLVDKASFAVAVVQMPPAIETGAPNSEISACLTHRSGLRSVLTNTTYDISLAGPLSSITSSSSKLELEEDVSRVRS